MPRVSAEADSVSAMRMTRSAMGTVRISRYDGSARSFFKGSLAGTFLNLGLKLFEVDARACQRGNVLGRFGQQLNAGSWV